MHIICDDSDRARWLELRRNYLTASDISTFMGTAPSYFTGSKEDLIAEKLHGTERIFGGGTQASVVHGRFDEDNNLKKASKLFGLPMVPYHYLVGATRWPFLAATLDGLGMVEYLVPPDVSYAKTGTRYGRFDTQGQVLETIDELEGLKGVCIVEMKQTSSHIYKRKDEKRAWIEELPGHIIPQVQTQMWIADIPQCLVVGQLGSDNMTGYLVFRDDKWAATLDAVNQEASIALAERYPSSNEVGF